MAMMYLTCNICTRAVNRASRNVTTPQRRWQTNFPVSGQLSVFKRLDRFLIMKALVGNFNKEKALVGIVSRSSVDSSKNMYNFTVQDQAWGEVTQLPVGKKLCS